MGFKCPNCHEDFGKNKKKFKEHLEENPDCNVEAWLHTDFWNRTLEYGPKHKSNTIRCERNHRHYSQISENHNWQKVNIVTNLDGSDTVRCTLCGLTAKRYGCSMKFDMRQINKIENCIYGKKGDER
jgi:uncharacterized C2H2 Zn-finger protein